MAQIVGVSLRTFGQSSVTLPDMADKGALAPIAEMFAGDTDVDDRAWWTARRAAAVDFAGRNDRVASAALEAALGAPDDATRQAAIYVLSLRGDSERLIEVARSSARAKDRDYALICLSYDAPSEAAVETVISAAILDPEPRVRLRTREFLAFNLVGVRKIDPKPRLREFIRRGSIRHRWRALRALRRVRKHERSLSRIHLTGWRRTVWLKYRHAWARIRDWRSEADD